MILALLPAIAALLMAAPAGAQTADDLFNDDTVTDLTLRMNARDWAQLRTRFMENTFYPCDIAWRQTTVRNAGCRSRGFGSRSAVKPGLLVDFDYYVTGQTFVGLRSLVLDNLLQDPSMIRERLSMALFARMGLPAPRQAYARLLLGVPGEYIGLYAISEDIDQGFMSRLGEPEAFLYEYHWTGEYRFEDLGPDLDPYAALFEPRTHERESTASLYGPLREMVRGINEAGQSDVPTILGEYIDLHSWLTHLAVENYLAEWDGLCGYAGVSNFYLYRSPETPQFRLIPWDKDSTFAWVHMPPDHNFDAGVLTRTIWRHRTLRTAYLRALLGVADAAATLEADAERLYDLIRAAALEDPLKPYSNEAFGQAVDEIRMFARERHGIVRGFVGPMLSPAGIRPAVAGSR